MERPRPHGFDAVTRRSWRVVLGWGIVGTLSGIVLVGGIMSATRLRSTEALITDLVWPVTICAFGILGAVIISRQPRNTIGWLLLVSLFAGLEVVTEQAPRDPGFFTYIGLWIASVSWTLFIMPIFLLLALFPTGRPVSPKWRWHTVLVGGMWAFFVLYATFASEITDLEGRWVIDNPIGFLPLTVFESPVFLVVWTLGLIVSAVGGIAAIVVRFRRAAVAERQQLKWLLFAFSAFAVVYVMLTLANDWDGDRGVPLVIEVLFPMSVLFIPVAITIAIVRHRVFDIDMIVRRTVVYAIVTGLLTAVYLGSVLASRILLQDALGVDSSLGVAVSTLIVAMLFNPLRTSVRRVVTKRFFRTPYDAPLLLSAFAQRLRDETDVDRVSQHMVGTVVEALHPASVAVWYSSRSAALEPAN